MLATTSLSSVANCDRFQSISHNVAKNLSLLRIV